MLMDGTPLFTDRTLSPCTFSRVNIYTHRDSIVLLSVLLSTTDFDNLIYFAIILVRQWDLYMAGVSVRDGGGDYVTGVGVLELACDTCWGLYV